MSVELRNWKGTIRYDAAVVERVESVDEIVRIVRDRETYPSPVRVRGSHHSTTACIVAEGGTVIDMRAMNRILEIDEEAMTIRMEAGVLHIDAARELALRGLQFYVNIELGNLTVGSGACCATKDASYISDGIEEYGQVASYCVGIRAVQADGTLLDVGEHDELMPLMRSSYGLLGVIYEVTYRIKRMRPMCVEHEAYEVGEFGARLDELIARGRSMMLYLFPFRNRVVVEYRYDGGGAITQRSWQWHLRNWVWKTGSPAFGRTVTACLPRRPRSWVLDRYHGVAQDVLTGLLRGRGTCPADQIIRYPESAGFASYTFSIWSFAQQQYADTIRAYFEFCQQYFQNRGYRCDLLNVGYRIAQDRQSLFSYTRDGPALTLDPVSTGARGWLEFLDAYNHFCSEHDGRPLFNQSRGLTRAQVQRAFGPEIDIFERERGQRDPRGRFQTPFFARLLGNAWSAPQHEQWGLA